MLAARLCACSGNAWLRPDGDGAIPTTRALLPSAEVAGTIPTGTEVCALRRPSVPRESSPSLKCRKAVCARRFWPPFLRGLDVLAFGVNGREKCVGEESQGDVTVPAVPASHLVVGKPYLSFGLLKSDLHSPAAASYLRQLLQRGAFGGEDRVGGEFFGVLGGAAHE